MSRSFEELVAIRDLPQSLRADHCFNDLQHAMLVILFRRAMLALDNKDRHCTDQMIDNITLYLYIHFLNEEEGMAFNLSRGLLDRDGLAGHSEMHIKFLDYWKNKVLLPYKQRDLSLEGALEEVSKYYNLIIDHIDGVDQEFYGVNCDLSVEQIRTELARVSITNMPMSPFMAGALESVKILAPDVALALDQSRLSPAAMLPIKELNLVPNVGRVLKGGNGSLRDRFATVTRGDKNAATGANEVHLLRVA